jgi:membrane protein DedA with SNARE-associated domain
MSITYGSLRPGGTKGQCRAMELLPGDAQVALLLLLYIPCLRTVSVSIPVGLSTMDLNAFNARQW